MHIVLHKTNGTTITYKDVTALHFANNGVVCFTSTQYGKVESNLPYQIKFNPPARGASDPA